MRLIRFLFSALLALSWTMSPAAAQEFLPPEEAFQLRIVAAERDAVQLEWQLADGYYLYRQQFGFEVDGDADVTIGTPVFPEGTPHEDEFFGKQEVYYDNVIVQLPIDAGENESFSLNVRYQGCADAGLCYPPTFQTVDVDLSGSSASSTAAPGIVKADESEATMALSEQDQLARLITDSRLAWVVLAFLGFGLLLTFTPCVLPMVPILSSIIAGQKNLTTRKAFLLSLVYVLAMALTYTAAGVLAGLFGANLQAMFQNPYVLAAFSAVFVLLALSMFGFYELQVPAALQTRLSRLAGNQQGGTTAGVAIMGVFSALIVGPCVAAPLAGALIVIGQSGDPVRGGIALFSLAIGMGIPLLLVGTSAGRFVPRAGAWMSTVKSVFGVLLLALAIYMLGRVLPAAIVVAMWSTLAIVSAVYMGAFAPARIGWQKLWKGVGIVVFTWGIALLIGLASGHADVLAPLKGFTGGSAATEESLAFKRIKTVADLEREVLQAAAFDQPVMLDFYADWCISCKEMERYTFSDPAVQAALANTLLLQADVTANDADDQALLKHFGLYGPPGIIFFDREGDELRHLRVIGFEAADEFAGIAAAASAP